MLKINQQRYWTSGTWLVDMPFWLGKLGWRAMTTRPGAIVGWAAAAILFAKDVGIRENFLVSVIRSQHAVQELITSWAGRQVDLEVVTTASAFGGAGKGIVNGDEDPARIAAENQDLMRRLDAGEFNGTKTPRKKGAKRTSGSSATPIETGEISEEVLPGSTPYTRGLNAGMIPNAEEYVEALVDGVRQWIPRMGQRERDRERGKLLRQ